MLSRIGSFCTLLIACLTLLLTPSPLLASASDGSLSVDETRGPAVVSIGEEGRVPLGYSLLFMKDNEGLWGLSEAKSQTRWVANKNDRVHFGLADNVIWVKWDVVNSGSRSDWLLELGSALVNSANLYIKHPNGDIESFITGSEHPFYQRPYQHRNLVFPVTLEKDEHVAFYLRLASTQALDLPITLWHEEQFLKHEININLLGGLFFGMALIIVFYNLFMYLVLSEKSYVFFVLFVLGFVLTCSSRFGISYQYGWPNYPLWNHYSTQVFGSLMLAFLSVFFLAWIEIKERLVERMLIFTAGMGAVLTIISFLFSPLVILLFYGGGLVVCLSAALYGTFAELKRHCTRAEHYAVLAVFCLAVGVFYDLLLIYHVIEHQALSNMFLPIASLFFMLFVSVAMTERIDQERKERLLEQEATLKELSERDEAESSLIHCVLHDGLTGCPNKGLLLSRLQKELDMLACDKEHRESTQHHISGEQEERRDKSKLNEIIHIVNDMDIYSGDAPDDMQRDAIELFKPKSLSLIVVHLKRFREINNTIGTIYSGELLITVCRRLCCLVAQMPRIIPIEEGESDSRALVCAMEDATFALVCNESNERNLHDIGEKILDTINRPVEYDGMVLDVHGYIGMSHYPSHGTTPSELLRKALIALDVARSKDLLQLIYSNDVDPYSARSLSLAGDLKSALQVDKLELYYQPQVSLRDDEVIGVEALIRWIHPKYGFIPPDEFVLIAEQAGIIRQLTAWVLETAIAKLNVWESEGLDLNISVNLSAKNLDEHDLVDRIELLIDQYGVSSDNLSLEITETAMMADPKQALMVLNAINDAGIGLSVDDFGIGYSSLAYLKRLPVTELKIDRSFVMEMCKDTDDQVIVNTTLNMSHSLGMTVVAEGVEDRETLNTLRRLGCDIAQGYYICKPAPAPAFEQWLRKTEFSVKHKGKDQRKRDQRPPDNTATSS